jgi:hypothetical protein
MSILTKPSNPISANTEIEMELSIPELLTLVESLTNSSYWEDTSNWRIVDFVFTNDQKQYQRVVFKVYQNQVEVLYKFSAYCINGLFECSRITVFGNVNDSLRINKSAYGGQFDVIIVDGIGEEVTVDIGSIDVPADGTYSEGDVLDFTLNFSGLVDVEGSLLLTEYLEPILFEDGSSMTLEDTKLILDVGGVTRYADYYSGSPSNLITYRYVVQSDDQDLDGIEVVAVELNGGTIIGVNGENVDLTLPIVDTSGILINNVVPDTEQPTILNINVVDGTYTNTDEIVFTMTFSEPVSITGSPELALDVGGVSKVASLVSSSSTEVVFSYTVGSNDNDADGISIVSLDNGVIQDAALNLLDRTLPAVYTSNVIVFNDVTAPIITSVTPPANNTYTEGQQLNFTVNFSEIVNVTGVPFLQVLIGSAAKQADYISGTGSSSLLFRYTIASGDEDTDGITFVSNSVQTPSATIRDVAGNDAIPTFTAPIMTGVIIENNSIFEQLSTNSITGDYINQLKYEPVTNTLYMSKVSFSGFSLDFLNSSGLVKSVDYGDTFTQVTQPSSFVSFLRTSLTGNVYLQQESEPLSSSEPPQSTVYQSLDGGNSYTLSLGASFFSSSNTVYDPITERFYKLDFGSNGNLIAGPNIISGVSFVPLRLNYSYYGNAPSITSKSINGDYVYIGLGYEQADWVLRTKVSEWTYNALAFGGPHWSAPTESLNMPLSLSASDYKEVVHIETKDNYVGVVVSVTNLTILEQTWYLFYSNNYGDSFSSVALPPQTQGVAIGGIHMANSLYISFVNNNPIEPYYPPTGGSVYRTSIDSPGTFSNLNFPEVPGLITSGDGRVYISGTSGTIYTTVDI